MSGRILSFFRERSISRNFPVTFAIDKQNERTPFKIQLISLKLIWKVRGAGCFVEILKEHGFPYRVCAWFNVFVYASWYVQSNKHPGSVEICRDLNAIMFVSVSTFYACIMRVEFDEGIVTRFDCCMKEKEASVSIL